MKIGLVCPYDVTAGGGVQECVFAIRDELIRRGHEVYIISPMPRRSDGVPPDGVIYVGKAAQVKSFHTTSQISASAENEAIENLLSEHLFDVLHFHEPWVPFVSRQILRRSDACNIATFHAKLPENRMNKTIERLITPYTKSILKYLDGMTAVSDAAADYVKTLTDESLHIVPNGIDLKKYKTATTKKQESTKTQKIAYIGRLERRKGIKYLLFAFKELQKNIPNAQLEIGGDGPEKNQLQRIVKQHNIQNVTFLGYLSEEEKLDLLHSADLFSSPAIYGESFGIVLLEAMAMGLPIVAGDNVGYTSVMREFGNISLANPKNTNLYSARIELLLTDKVLRKQWQAWAKQYVSRYSYEEIVNSYENLYETFCKRKKKG